jgi:hypothetical protein
MAVCFYLTHTDAVLLHDMCFDPRLRAILRRQIAADLIPADNEPRTVIFRDEGDGEVMVAVTYDHDAAADRAFEAAWKALQGETEEETRPAAARPTRRRRA